MASPVIRTGRVVFAAACLVALSRCLPRGKNLDSEVDAETDVTFLSPRGSAARASTPPISPEAAATRHARTEQPSSEASGNAVWASMVVASVCLAGAWQRSRRAPKTRRRADIVYKGDMAPVYDKLPPWVESVVDSGATESDLTKEELDTFLENRCAALRKMVPSADEDFDDEVSELTWQWARHLLPYMDLLRHQMAGYKRRSILRQRDFFEKLRLFKPLAMKYPTLLKRFQVTGHPDIEDTKFRLNPEFIYMEEKVAGFTYEDFVKETGGNKYDKWEQPNVGDVITGKVVAFARDGAFVEVGGKSWAYMPLKNISLAPIASPDEALEIGQEIEALIVEIGADSTVPGDYDAQQMVLSRSVIQKDQAWEQVKMIYNGEGGDQLERTVKVNVKSLNAMGAVVQAENGLEGFIRSGSLADKADDPRIVGTDLTVEIESIREDVFLEKNPRPGNYYIYFSYANAATKALARTVEEYDLVEGTVISVSPVQALVEVQGAPCRLSKMNVSSVTQDYDMTELFEEGEQLKCVVIRRDRVTGEVVLSTRALEPKRGMMLTDRALCFEKAEETRLKFKEASMKEKQEAEAKLEAAGFGDPVKKPTKPVSSYNVMDDDDDEVTF